MSRAGRKVKVSVGALAVSCEPVKSAQLDMIRRLPAALRGAVLREAVRAGGQVLLDGARRRMPTDSGTARDALRLKVARVSCSVEYDTQSILANQRGGNKRNRYFYPAAIEYGLENRPPVAPLRRTEDEDGPAAARAFAATLSHELSKLEL
jgi:hypothetical protein